MAISRSYCGISCISALNVPLGYCVKVKAQKYRAQSEVLWEPFLPHTYYFSPLVPFDTPSSRLWQTASHLPSLLTKTSTNNPSPTSLLKRRAQTLYDIALQNKKEIRRKKFIGKKKNNNKTTAVNHFYGASAVASSRRGFFEGISSLISDWWLAALGLAWEYTLLAWDRLLRRWLAWSSMSSVSSPSSDV